MRGTANTAMHLDVRWEQRLTKCKASRTIERVAKGALSSVNSFETIVLGLGAMGSAAVHQLSRKKHRVLGIDQYAPPHEHGSTHGDTRITRLAIGEGEQYTPLALRSHELWREIERQTGTRLLTTPGALILSSPATTAVTHVEGFYENTLAAAKKYGIAHELLDAQQIRLRFPQFRVRDDEVGYFEMDAGFVRPEACVRAQLKLAQHHGAEIHTGEKVLGFDASPSSVRVATDRGAYSAGHLIVTAGPWLPGLLGEPWSRCFRVSRQVLFWFDMQNAAAFVPERFPVFIWELQDAAQGIYGFPAIDGPRGGVKIATEQFRTETTPESVDAKVGAHESRAMYDMYVAPNLSGLSAKCLRAVTCLYTVTPDFGFVIDTHPDFERVLIVSPCSGHGFKHSPAIGEALAELIRDGASRLDLSGFTIERFETLGVR
jgi:sarcosine oxidase